jgi:hypothetical protein
MPSTRALIVATGFAALSLFGGNSFGQNVPARTTTTGGITYVSRTAASDASAPLYQPSARPAAPNVTAIPREAALNSANGIEGKPLAKTAAPRSRWHWTSKLGKFMASKRSAAEKRRHPFIDPATGSSFHPAMSKPWVTPVW